MTARALSGSTTEGRPTRVLVFGASGVLGRCVLALLVVAGREVQASRPSEVDIFDADALRHALRGANAVYDLAWRRSGAAEAAFDTGVGVSVLVRLSP